MTLAKDGTHFVRQGAFMALAMVLIEVSEKANPKVVYSPHLFYNKIIDHLCR